MALDNFDNAVLAFIVKSYMSTAVVNSFYVSLALVVYTHYYAF